MDFYTEAMNTLHNCIERCIDLISDLSMDDLRFDDVEPVMELLETCIRLCSEVTVLSVNQQNVTEIRLLLLEVRQHLSSSVMLAKRDVGRPRIEIPKSNLEELKSLGFSWSRIASMFNVSKWTILRRSQEYGLSELSMYSNMTDADLDGLVNDYIDRHGRTTGEPFLSGYLRSLGYTIQRYDKIQWNILF